MTCGQTDTVAESDTHTLSENKGRLQLARNEPTKGRLPRVLIVLDV